MGIMRKKICMLGTFAVGKTSLVARYVHGIFSDKYLTTIGVKIDKKPLVQDGKSIELILWDLNGEDRFQKFASSYLRGTDAYLLVVDGTRRSTLEAALTLHERAQDKLGEVPFVLLLNKADLVDEWELEDEDWAPLKARGWTILQTSAKLGTRVDEAFDILARQLVLP